MKRLLASKVMYGLIILFALSAFAGTTQADSLFSDNFDSGNFNNWNSSTGVTISTIHHTSGDSADFYHTATLQKNLSTAGYATIQVQCWGYTTNSSKVTIKIDYSTDGGSNWTSLGTISAGSWTSYAYTCPSAANNNPNFQVRFTSSGSGSDNAYLDDVQIIGTPSAPAQATTPNPANAATNVSLTPTLGWTAGPGATSHDVYFGTNSASPTFIGNQAGTTYAPGTLSTSATYYWRIDEKNTVGTTTGTLWSFTTVPPPPGLATTPSPVDTATDVSLTPTLSWTAGSGATSHDVYFGTNSASPTFIGNQAGTTYTPAALSTSRTYYWRIDEKNVGGTTTGTLWSFTTVPPPPGLATAPSPTNAATNVSLTPTLSWTAGSGATSHDVYFGTNSASPTFIGNQAGTTYTPGTLSTSRTYYWRINEKNAGGTTTGTLWSFTTVPPPPGLATAPNPANTATNVSLTPTLSWTAGSGATSHDVYFGTNSANPTFIGNQAGTTYVPGTLSTSATYYWRIDEKNAGGTTTGTLWSFTTVPPPPAQATTPSPVDTATDVSLTPTLSWTAGSGATSHDVYFGTNSASPTFIGNQAGTTYTPSTLSTSRTYYWRINEKNAGGTTTGTLWRFTTVPPPPGLATTPNPANAATNVSKTATLSWTAGSGATSHDVYFGTVSPGTFQGNQTGTTFNPGTMSNGTTYYWRIDEKNTGGTTTGTVWNFTVLPTRTLTASAGSGGTITTPGVGSFPYDNGTVVNITATADTNYHFVNWTGTGVTAGRVANPNSASTTITMDGNYTVVANFAIDQKALTTSTTTGGTVTTPGVGTYNYDYNTAVNIVATPNANYHFVNWTGTSVTAGKVANPNSASTTITMDDNYTVTANFAIDQKTLTASSGGNGSVTTPGDGEFVYDYGTVVTLAATPITNYHFVNWTGSGVAASKVANPNSASTTITLDGNYTVVANFAIDQKSLTTSATTGGTVTTPGIGAYSYDYGTVTSITAVPNTGYHFVNWTGTGVTAGKVTSPTSASTTITMDGDYTVVANFAIDQYTVTVSAGANGSIDPVGDVTKDHGSSQLFTATPATGYEVDKWSVDSADVQTGGTTYTLSDITATHTVHVSFKILTYTVTASAGDNGTIDPSGSITKDYGSSQQFTATPNTGYEVDKWSVDSNDVQTGGATYTLSGITAAHTVHVTFKILTYTVTASAGSNGTIDPVGAITKDYGSSQLFTATPNTGYEVDKWTVDSNDVQTGGATYTLSNITAVHTVAVSFKILTYTVTASAGTNGSIDPSGDITKDYGSSQLFTATPDTGYEVDKWFVDGAEVQTGGLTYTLSDITAIHTVSVTFKLNMFVISGYIIEPDGNTPVVGVTVDANNNGGSLSITDANGYYEVTVPPGWSGTATPIKAGFSFEPYKMIYKNVTASTEKDYAATPLTYIISGHVLKLDGTPISDVNVAAENGGGPYTTKYGKVSNDGGPCLGRFGSGSAVTDANGYYEVMVDYNWSGKVTPAKYAYACDPNSKSYASVVADQNAQDYTGTLMTFAISGYVRNDCDTPIKGVTVSADNGGNTVATDANGFYEVWVSYKWTGTVTVIKALYTFATSSLGYTDVLSNQTSQNYQGGNIYDLDCDGSIGYGDIAVIGDNWLSDAPGNICDLNADGIVNFIDYAEFANIWTTEAE